jgi:hypothetical protein
MYVSTQFKSFGNKILCLFISISRENVFPRGFELGGNVHSNACENNMINSLKITLLPWLLEFEKSGASLVRYFIHVDLVHIIDISHM